MVASLRDSRIHLGVKPKSDFQQRLMGWRKQFGYDQIQAAAELHTNVRTFQNWEQGRNAPNRITMAYVESIIAGDELASKFG